MITHNASAFSYLLPAFSPANSRLVLLVTVLVTFAPADSNTAVISSLEIGNVHVITHETPSKAPPTELGVIVGKIFTQ